MKYIESTDCRLEIGPLTESSFATLLQSKYAKAKKVILVDENTHVNCLEYVITSFEDLHDAEVMLLPAGEENKSLDIAVSVWEALTDYGVSRYDVMINLGGGLITDMGGFIASCYKRGIDFINIPTSLLAMVDASIGGKTGLNLGHYKNQIGVFNNPEVVFIDTAFLQTLPDHQLMSGYAEMIKHGLISDEELYRDVMTQLLDPRNLNDELLVRCIQVKNEVVTSDPLEGGLRKILNFGHTIGHVIEGHYMDEAMVTHGHCVALGMIMETYLSARRGLLDETKANEIQNRLLEFYPLPKYSDDEMHAMIEMLSNDKKNKNDKILCCLLNDVGSCVYDQEITVQEFVETFLHFKGMRINLN